jgi:spore germination protein GerM
MKKILAGLIGVLIVGIFIGYGVSWFLQQPQQNVTQQIPLVVKEELPAQQVRLYFTAPEGTYLQAETRTIQGCEEERQCLSDLVHELIRGPQGDLLPVLPAETQVLGVSIEEDLATINFSRHLVDYHPGGSLAELLSLASLANSLTENYPYIRQVQLLIAGERQPTLKGHGRIDQPLTAAFDFNQPPATGPYPEVAEVPEGGRDLSIEGLIEKAETGD